MKNMFYDEHGRPFRMGGFFGNNYLLGLKAATDTSLLGSFERNLVPTATERANSSSHRQSLESALKWNEVTRFFQTGSFKFGTGLRGISDADYLLVFNKSFAFQTLFRVIHERLDNRYPGTIVRVDNPAICVDFATKPRYEIIPAISCGTSGGYEYFQISDGGTGFKYTCPEYYNDLISRENDRLDKKLKPLIRLVKAWSYFNGLRISSTYLETYTTSHCKSLHTINYGVELQSILYKFSNYGFLSVTDPLGIEDFKSGLGGLSLALAQAKAGEHATALALANRTFIGIEHIGYLNQVFNGNFRV